MSDELNHTRLDEGHGDSHSLKRLQKQSMILKIQPKQKNQSREPNKTTKQNNQLNQMPKDIKNQPKKARKTPGKTTEETPLFPRPPPDSPPQGRDFPAADSVSSCRVKAEAGGPCLMESAGNLDAVITLLKQACLLA